MRKSGLPIPAEYTQLHYSTKFTKAYYRYVIANFDASLFYHACDHFRIDKNYLLSDNNWVSHEFLKDFRDHLKELTGDADLPYHIGKGLLTTDNINPFERAILRILPASLFFRIFTFNSKKLNKVSEYIVRENRMGRAIIELHSPGELKHNRDICRNAIGIFESFEEALGLNDVRVVHTQCIHQGGERCLFEITFSARSLWIRRGVLVGSFAGISGLSWALGEYLPVHQTMLRWLIFFGVTGYSLLLFLLMYTYDLFRSHFVHIQQNVSKNAEIFQKRERLEYRDQESTMLRELSLKLNEGLTPNEIIRTSIADLKEKFGFSRILVMLHNPINACLFTQDIAGFSSPAECEVLHGLRLKYPNPYPEKKDLFANILDEGKVRLIQDVQAFSLQLDNLEYQGLLKLLRVNSLIVAPICDAQSKFGLIVLGSFGNERALDEYDRELVVKVSLFISVAFKNSKSLETQKQLADLFKKYVPAMVTDNLSGQVTQLGHATSTEIVSFFCDLRDFTQTSQKLQPEQVKIMLDIYIDYVTERIARFGGVIDKILGDGINAFFPRKISDFVDQDYINRAFLTSADILSSLDVLAHRFEERGFPAPRLGIGLNAGTAFVGSFGSALKMDYSAIGDTVNLAARLQGMAKELSQELFRGDRSLIVASSSVSDFLTLQHWPVATLERSIRGRSGTVIVAVFDQQSLKRKTSRSSGNAA